MRAIYLALCLCITAAAGATDYPTRPIRLLIGFPPGAGMDAVARPYAQRLGEILGQPVIVENRPGAGGAVSNAGDRQVGARWLHARLWLQWRSGDRAATDQGGLRPRRELHAHLA